MYNPVAKTILSTNVPTSEEILKETLSSFYQKEYSFTGFKNKLTQQVNFFFLTDFKGIFKDHFICGSLSLQQAD